MLGRCEAGFFAVLLEAAFGVRLRGVFFDDSLSLSGGLGYGRPAAIVELSMRKKSWSVDDE